MRNKKHKLLIYNILLKISAFPEKNGYIPVNENKAVVESRKFSSGHNHGLHLTQQRLVMRRRFKDTTAPLIEITVQFKNPLPNLRP